MLNMGTWLEILLIGVAALVLFGPQDMIKIMKGLGRVMFHIRRWSLPWRAHWQKWMEEGEIEAFDQYQKKQAQKKTHEEDHKS